MGRVVAITVAYEDGTTRAPVLIDLIDLTDMRRYCRAERVDDLLDDLLMLCGDVQAAQTRRPSLRVIRATR